MGAVVEAVSQTSVVGMNRAAVIQTIQATKRPRESRASMPTQRAPPGISIASRPRTRARHTNLPHARSVPALTCSHPRPPNAAVTLHVVVPPATSGSAPPPQEQAVGASSDLIKQLTDMGFERQNVVQALTQTSNDFDRALQLLLQG